MAAEVLETAIRAIIEARATFINSFVLFIFMWRKVFAVYGLDLRRFHRRLAEAAYWENQWRSEKRKDKEIGTGRGERG